LGSKLLHVAQHFDHLMARNDAALWLAGKSILGGFLGGTLGVEIGKRLIGWHAPTGDAWVPALAAGLIVGRVGCQLSGTWDQTYGTPTALPWAWDYGDGVGRHPVSLYEVVLVAAAYLASRAAGLRRHAGAAFAAFMAGY
jgi:prolipoprotein diacylglyceryltransferase